MEFKINSKDFLLILEPEIYDTDIACMCDTILKVRVKIDDFSAETSFDTDSEYFKTFTDNICKIYETLSGSAKIYEDSDDGMYIFFEGDGKGHISVKGKIHSRGYENTNRQTLIFENEIDQTCLENFYAD